MSYLLAPDEPRTKVCPDCIQLPRPDIDCELCAGTGEIIDEENSMSEIISDDERQPE